MNLFTSLIRAISAVGDKNRFGTQAHISNYLVPYQYVPGWRSWPFAVGHGIHAGPIYFTERQFPEMMSPS
jgi:hypothetical protein